MRRFAHSRLMFPYNRNDIATPDMDNFFPVLLHPLSPFNPCSTCDKMRQTLPNSQSGICSFCYCCCSPSSSRRRRINADTSSSGSCYLFFPPLLLLQCLWLHISNACRISSYFGSRAMGNYRLVGYRIAWQPYLLGPSSSKG